jgi:hypothetical protein
MVSSERDRQADSTIRKGANIITRTIFATTAVLPASTPTALPAATTCATSWMVEPMKIPKALDDI